MVDRSVVEPSDSSDNWSAVSSKDFESFISSEDNVKDDEAEIEQGSVVPLPSFRKRQKKASPFISSYTIQDKRRILTQEERLIL